MVLREGAASNANLVEMHGNGGMRYFMRQHLVNANLVQMYDNGAGASNTPFDTLLACIEGPQNESALPPLGSLTWNSNYRPTGNKVGSTGGPENLALSMSYSTLPREWVKGTCSNSGSADFQIHAHRFHKPRPNKEERVQARWSKRCYWAVIAEGRLCEEFAAAYPSLSRG